MRDWKDDFIQWWKGEKQLLPYGGFGLNKIKGGRSLWEILNKIEQIIKQVEDKARGEERLKISRLISKISKEVEDKRSSLAIVWLNMELSSRLAREYLKDSKEDRCEHKDIGEVSGFGETTRRCMECGVFLDN